MSIFTKLFGKKRDSDVDLSEKTAEEFMMLIRTYYQGVIAMNLGVTNLNMLPDLALFKRMLKIPTQGNKLGQAEKSKAKKILMSDYGLSDGFFKEIDTSIKKNCRSQQQIQPYFFQFQGFCNDLFTLLDSQMKWKFRFSMLMKKTLRTQTEKTVHEMFTKQEWDKVEDQKIAWRARKTADSMGYSEPWAIDLVYNMVLLARDASKRELKSRKKKED